MLYLFWERSQKMNMNTILDIGKSAGVSKSTVSRVLNDDPNVKPATREKVKRAISKLNYTPNLMARGMRMKKTFSIGIIFPDLSNPFFSEWYKTIDRAMQASGYLGYICITDPKGTTELKRIEDLVARNIDGVIFSTYVKNQAVINKLRELSKTMAVVCCDDVYINEGLQYVTYDGRAGTFNAMMHLAKQGRQRLAYIKGARIYDVTQPRFQGYVDALKHLGIP